MMADEPKKEEVKKEEVKPSESSNPKPEPAKETAKPEPKAEPREEKPEKAKGGESSSNGHSKLMESLVEENRALRDKKEKLEMLLAEREARARQPYRVFKSGFKVRKS